MERLDTCPACLGGQAIAAYADNDLSEIPQGDTAIGPELRRSDYVVCTRCQLIYARWRQVNDEMSGYYALFAKYEHRGYASYPPPEAYIRGKMKRVAGLVGHMERLGIIRSGMKVLNLRSEAGALGVQLREKHGLTDVYGLECFETNVRYTRETAAMAGVEFFVPNRLAVPFNVPAYDLIVASHIMTHALAPRQMMDDLRSLLKPDGALLLYGEVDHVRAFAMGWRFASLGINNFHKQLLTPAALRNLASVSGFSYEPLEEKPPYFFDVILRPASPVKPDDLPSADAQRTVAAFRRWGRLHQLARLRRAADQNFPGVMGLLRLVRDRSGRGGPGKRA